MIAFEMESSLSQEGQLLPATRISNPSWAPEVRARRWEHHKMFPLEMYSGPTIPPARPCGRLWPSDHDVDDDEYVEDNEDGRRIALSLHGSAWPSTG